MSTSIATPRDLIRGGEAIARGRDDLRLPWLYPSRNSRPVSARGSAPIPPFPGLVGVLTYQVPAGFRFSLRALTVDVVAGGYSDGAGDFTWSLVTGLTAGPAYTVPDYDAVPTRLGSLANGPYPVFGRMVFEPGETLALQFTAVNPPDPGPAFVTGILLGHLYPTSEESI